MSYFFRTSYSNGLFLPKRWATHYKQEGFTIGSACEYSALPTVIGALQAFEENGLRYFPSVEYAYKPEMTTAFARSSLILFAKTAKAYTDIIRCNNESHRRYFYRVPAVTDELLQQMQEEKREFNLLLTTGSQLLLKSILRMEVSTNAEEAIDAFVGEYDRLVSIYPNTQVLVDTPLHDSYFTNETFKMVVRAIESGKMEIQNFLFSPIAYYPTPKERNLAFIQQKIKTRGNFPNDSPLVKNSQVVSFIENKQDDFWTTDRVSLLKELLAQTDTQIQSIDFTFKLRDYHMPSVGVPKEEEEILLAELLLKGWNAKATDYDEYLEDVNHKRVFRGNWGVENVKCDSLEEVFNLNSYRSERLKFEFKTIKDMGFIGYFLIVEDVIRYADTKNLPRNKAGRGSAAGCLISYILDITGVDPIQSDSYGELLFERFLNPSRVSMPDIDLDFSSESRDKIIKYIKKKYGDDRVVIIGSYKVQRIKQVLKDVHRSYCDRFQDTGTVVDAYHVTAQSRSYSIEMINAITKSTAKAKQDGTYREIVEACKEESTLFAEFYERHADIVDGIVEDLCECMRGDKSNHPSGYLILPNHVDECLPIRFVQNKPTGNMISHYEMGECEDAGYVKLDCLNVNAVGMMARTCELVEKGRGIRPLSMNEIDLEDPLTIAEIQRDSYGIFQFKSEIQRGFLDELKPETFAHLYDSVALCRTGPMQAGAHTQYVNLVRGSAYPQISHPTMNGALEKTYGLIIYQEQVMRLAQDMAGFSLAEADNLRRAIGKKKPEEMKKYTDLFIDGCRANGIARDLAVDTWEKINFFSGYGFNMCVTGDTYVTKINRSGELYHVPIEWMYIAHKIKSSIRSVVSQYEWDETGFDNDELAKTLAEAIMQTPYWEKYTNEPTEIRNTNSFWKGDCWNDLLNMAKTQHYGSSVSYSEIDGRGVRNNILSISKIGPSPTLKIKVGDNREISVSPTHQFTTVRNGNLQEKMAAALEIGDLIICLDLCAQNPKSVEGLGYLSLDKDLVDTAKEKPSLVKSSPAIYENKTNLDKTGIGTYLAPVLEISVSGVEPIFEMEYASPHHRYFSNGILSHNSHAVSYSIMGVYMGYLKAYFPIEYWCGVLAYSSESREMSNNVYELKAHIESIGVDVEYPSYKKFRLDYEPTGVYSLSWPLHSLSGVSKTVAGSIYKSSSKGSFGSVDEFFEKVDKVVLNLRIFKALLFSGFFDDDTKSLKDIVMNRAKVIDLYWKSSGRKGKASEAVRTELIQQQMKRSLVFYNSYAAMKTIKKSSKVFFKYKTELLGDHRDYVAAHNGERVSASGVIVRLREYTQKNGKLMLFADLEDRGEMYNMLLFADAYEKFVNLYGKPKLFDVVQFIGRKSVSEYGVSVIVDDSKASEMFLIYKHNDGKTDEEFEIPKLGPKAEDETDG